MRTLKIFIFVSLFFQLGISQAGDLTFTNLNDQITLFNNGKVQSLVITGNTESVLIDPTNKSNTEEIKNYLKENNKPNITNIIYSILYLFRYSS